MSDDYFTRLERELAGLTRAGVHLDPPRRWSLPRWSALERLARRTAIVASVAIFLAALLVVEFPGSASGRAHRHSDAVTALAAPPYWIAVAITPRSSGGAGA